MASHANEPAITDSTTAPIGQNWAELLYKTQQSNHKELCDRIQSLEDSLNFNNEEMRALTSKVSDHDKKLDSVEHLTQKLEQKLAATEDKLKELEIKNVQLELYSRKENLIITGLPENQIWEKAEVTKAKVIELLNEQMGLNINADGIIVAHRLGRQEAKVEAKKSDGANSGGFQGSIHRPIIVRFVQRNIRDAVWEARFSLKSSDVYIKEDFPKSIQDQRLKLRPYMLRAKELGKKATCIDNYLLVDGQRFTVETLN